MSVPSPDYHPSDSELVRIAISQSRQAVGAFEQLVLRHQLPIRNFIAVLSGDMELARDLTQETFLRAYQRLSQLRDPGAFVSWIYQIARSIWTSYIRQRQWPYSFNQLAEQANRSKEFSYLDNEIDRYPERDLVVAVFTALKRSNREALYLRHIAGFSNSEIARILDISPAAARKRVHRADRLFQRQYYELSQSPVPSKEAQREYNPGSI